MNIQTLLSWVGRSFRRKGAYQTLKVAGSVLADLSFDLRYGTDTMRWVEPDALDAGDNQRHSVRYAATKARPFLKLLNRLDLPRDCNFVDIGSGKGRALLIASQYGFSAVIGIEFSRRLCEIARRNAELFVQKNMPNGWLSPIEVIEADATRHHFEAEDQVFFMFNPFDAFIMVQVMDNIRKSLEEHPRPTWLIYNTPVHHDIVKDSGLFRFDSFHEIGGNHYRVYSN